MDSISDSTDSADEGTWCYIPESVLREIYQYMSLKDLTAARQVCIRWNEIAQDDMLWKAIFYRDFHIDPTIDKVPSASSWYSEYRRLYEEVPVVLTETLEKHTNQVLHVSFSHDGKLFATASKDGTIVVWDASGYPCRAQRARDMSLLSWRHPQHSQFNCADTLLLVSGIHFGSPHNTSGEIAVLALPRLELQCRVVNKPYDVFGCWVGARRLLSGELRWLAHLTSLSTLVLNRASQEPHSERLAVRAPLFRIYNAAASSVRSVLIADDKERAGGQAARGGLPEPGSGTNCAWTADLAGSKDTFRIRNSPAYYAALARPQPGTDEEMEATSETGSAEAGSSEGVGGSEGRAGSEGGEAEGEGDGEEGSSADSTDSSSDEIIDKKLLIYTSGSYTYTPHQVSFKYIEGVRFPRHVSRGPSLSERLAARRERDGAAAAAAAAEQGDVHVRGPDWADYDSVKHMFDAPDVVLDLRAYIIGMTLTPDHKFLYVNVRCWPMGTMPWSPLQPPPVSRRVQLRVIALDTLALVAGHAPPAAHPSSLDLYQQTADCFFVFLDADDHYVASGGVDKCALVWDRHYGVTLARLHHADVVNALAFRPAPRPSTSTHHHHHHHHHPMLVTVSDDYSIRVWRSAREARRLPGGGGGGGGSSEAGGAGRRASETELYHRRRPCSLCD